MEDYVLGWVWWHTPLIQHFRGRDRQFSESEANLGLDSNFYTSQGYIVKLCAPKPPNEERIGLDRETSIGISGWISG